MIAYYGFMWHYDIKKKKRGKADVLIYATSYCSSGHDCPCVPQDNELVETEMDMVETFNYSEFDLIYVNGDNLLPNLRRDEDKWKVVLIEEEFSKRISETE